MPDEREQKALDQIKAYLDAGHEIDAIRQGGWSSWIDDLEAKGYDLQTGKLALRPPEGTLADMAPPAAKVSETPPAETAPPAAKVSGTPAADTPTCAKCGTERVGTRPYCVKCPTKWPDGTPPGRPVETGTWRQSKWLWAVGGVVVLLVGLVILGSVVGGGSNSDDSDQSTGPGVSDSNELPTKSNEPPPTQEPANETGSAAESPLFDDCTEFIDGVVVASEGAGQSMGQIAELATEAGMNPFIVFTSVWQGDLRAEYQRLRGARQDIASLNAPPAFQPIRALIIQGLDLFLASEEPLLEGADSFDADLIASASEFMIRGTGPITEATTLIEAMDLNECIG